MKNYTLLLGIVLWSTAATAQHSDDITQIRAVIDQFFEGMRTQDTAMMAFVMTPNMQMQTVAKVEGKTRLVAGNAAKFLSNVAAPTPQPWDERIWSYEIQLDGAMASVWTEYSFFFGERLLHCGVNQFMLLHDGSGWKIFYIVDTRRPNGCREE